jgi:diguanylate cyclase (GGDEF)-like protein
MLAAVEWMLRRRPGRPGSGIASSLSLLVFLDLVAALTGGLSSPALVWIATPVVSMALRFRPRVTAAFLVTALATVGPVALAASRMTDAQCPDAVRFACLATLLVSLYVVVRRLQVDHDDSRQSAAIDPLTGLRNRAGFAAGMADLRTRLPAEATASVLVCDIDLFKRINDTHGHIVGDTVLVEVARRLQRGLRPEDLACRFGGEEFVAVLPGLPLPDAMERAEQLRLAVAASPVCGSAVTVSIGVANGTFDTDQLIARADEALYRAKRSGRNRVAS